MRSLIILFTVFTSGMSMAKDHIIKTDKGSIVFQTNESEVSQRKFYGADLWFTGVEKEGKRSVMSIIHQQGEFTLDPNVTEKEFETHKDKMQKFAKDRGYTEPKFEPYQFIKLNEKVSYHSFIWSYTAKGQRYLEKSYYVECNKQFFIAKATTFESEVDDQSKFQKILETVVCK